MKQSLHFPKLKSQEEITKETNTSKKDSIMTKFFKLVAALIGLVAIVGFLNVFLFAWFGAAFVLLPKGVERGYIELFYQLVFWPFYLG